MAQAPKLSEKKDSPELSSANKQVASTPETSSNFGESRQEIAGTLAEGMDGSERISESAAEGREAKGDGAGKKQHQKDDDKKGSSQKFTFTFDEKNLPPAPVMIRKIEEALRGEVHKLEKRAKSYQGGIFKRGDYPKYSETMCEIRKKNVLLRRIVTLAFDALKKLFLQMFGRAENS